MSETCTFFSTTLHEYCCCCCRSLHYAADVVYLCETRSGWPAELGHHRWPMKVKNSLIPRQLAAAACLFHREFNSHFCRNYFKRFLLLPELGLKRVSVGISQKQCVCCCCSCCSALRSALCCWQYWAFHAVVVVGGNVSRMVPVVCKLTTSYSGSSSNEYLWNRSAYLWPFISRWPCEKQFR